MILPLVWRVDVFLCVIDKLCVHFLHAWPDDKEEDIVWKIDRIGNDKNRHVVNNSTYWVRAPKDLFIEGRERRRERDFLTLVGPLLTALPWEQVSEPRWRVLEVEICMCVFVCVRGWESDWSVWSHVVTSVNKPHSVLKRTRLLAAAWVCLTIHSHI